MDGWDRLCCGLTECSLIQVEMSWTLLLWTWEWMKGVGESFGSLLYIISG